MDYLIITPFKISTKFLLKSGVSNNGELRALVHKVPLIESSFIKSFCNSIAFI